MVGENDEEHGGNIDRYISLLLIVLNYPNMGTVRAIMMGAGMYVVK